MLSSVPSLNLTVIWPERQMAVCRVWQESVRAIGWTSFDQRQAGSKTPRQSVKSPSVTTSMCQWSLKGRVS